ncbi:putative membrane protein [[Clostridium] cellulosi]|uniref:Putative membrane protein n=1 Tax=[Clostridium] cellulosi TaxID=29343 RepID=A0A078KJH3_9FIRM|nr:putative membrane protein [[Clostridium] cellulosi]
MKMRIFFTTLSVIDLAYILNLEANNPVINILIVIALITLTVTMFQYHRRQKNYQEKN